MDQLSITKEYLEELRRRCASTTPGPWISFVEGRDHTSGDSVIVRGLKGSEEDLYLVGATIADQDFIANARQDIPLLLNEIDRLQSLLEGKKLDPG
ncbi:MAG: hypothetical protein AB9888_00105 [Bacteroidales bacterium]